MRLLVESPKPVLALGLLLTAGAIWPAARLSIETDPAALMPRGSEAAEDYRVFIDRFGGFEKVFVLVMAAEGAEDSESELIAAADRLASVLAGSPEVTSVRSGLVDEDLDFLRRYVAPRAPLLLGPGWRTAIEERITPEAIRLRAARIRRGASSPVGSADAPLLAGDPLGFSEALPVLRMRPSGLPVDPLTGAFLSPDGRAALVVVTPARTEIDPEGGRALGAELDRAYRQVGGRARSPLEFLAVGGPLYAAEDEALIKRDVRTSLVGSAIGCVVLLIAAFGSAGLPLLTVAAVASGLVWTAAWLEISIGTVTAAGLGFSAVLVGLGIDYGIHGAARYRQRLLAEDAPAAALGATLSSSGPGILTSALTTAGAFAVLSLAHFRPLRELGWMVAVGILCILLTSATVGAPLAVLIGARWSRRAPGRVWEWLGALVATLSGFAARRPLATLALLGLASGCAVWGLGRLSIDPDLRAFRSTDHSAFEAETQLVDRFGIGLETVTILVSDHGLAAAVDKAARVKELVLASAGAGWSVASPSDWLTGRSAAERLAELSALPLLSAADRLERELAAAGLDPEFFRPGLVALRELGEGRDPGAPPEDAWPDWLAELVRVGDGETLAALRIRAPESAWTEGPPAELVSAVKSVSGGRIASAPLVGAELRRLAARDLRALAGLAFAVVFLVVLASFRGSVRQSALALIPVLLGALWSLGVWGALDRPLDLVTLAVFPIILGIGLDDGLHALHALRRDPERGAVGALDETGRAMVLTTATTAVAFGSLAATSVPGLRNAGLMVSLGVLGCLGATLMALPALEALGRRRIGR